MGQKNNVICSYLSDPVVFADFINGCIHNGQRVVSPEQLADREAISCLREVSPPGTQSPRKPKYIQRQRICGGISTGGMDIYGRDQS